MQSILKEVGINSGHITSIKSNDQYLALKTGDKIVAHFGSDREFAIATVYAKDGEIYAIQNAVSGKSPDDDIWTKYGDYSFVIYDDMEPMRDHRNLCLYVDDGSPLRINNHLVNTTENILSYNLPVRKGALLSWENERSISISLYNLKKADFSIVFYISDMLKTDIKTPLEVNTSRLRAREGATKYISDDEYKRENLERYIRHIAKSMGISSDVVDLKNLEKLPQAVLAGRFALVSLTMNNAVKRLRLFIESVEALVKEYKELKERGDDDDDNDALIYQYERVINKYTEIREENYYRQCSENYQKSMEYLAKYESKNTEKVKTLLNTVIIIGEKIQKYISEKPIHTLTDVKMLKFKLESITNASNTDEFSITGNLSKWFDNIRDNGFSDAEYSLDALIEDRHELLGDHQYKLDNLHNYINSLL